MANAYESVTVQRHLVHVVQKPWDERLPLVSFIVPCFNYGSFIQQALDSIFSQTFQDFEVIVVESGSTDAVTGAIIDKICLPKTKVFRRGKRCLVGDNRNFGIAKAKGKYICCLDADDYLEPTFLEKAVFLMECAGFDIVSTSYRRFGEDELEVILPRHPSFAQVVGGASMPSVALFSKQYCQKLGGYRDTGVGAKHIPEDWDLLIRAAGAGARLYNLQEPLLNVRWHETSLNRNPENLTFEAQRIEIRRRNKDSVKHANFETFTRRNQSQFLVDNALINLAARQKSSDGKALLMIMPHCSNAAEHGVTRLPLLAEQAKEARLILVWEDSISTEQRAVMQMCSAITPHLFSLQAVSDDPQTSKLLIEHLINSRNVAAFYSVNSDFSSLEKISLNQLIDRVELVQYSLHVSRQ